jgi:hypothetical protein
MDGKPGDTRIVHKFLLFPISIGRENRWLEWAWVKERLEVYATGELVWNPEEFITPREAGED